MANEFFLEVGCEEIPARSMSPVLAELEEKFEELLREAKLGFEQVRTLGSARRLVVHVKNLADKQDTERLRTLGPPERIAFKDGEPSPALKGFARKSGVALEALEVFETDRGKYMGFESDVEGKPAAEILSARIPELVRSLFFSKTMYWVKANERFARPVRWVVALHGSNVVPVELYGIRAGSVSAGHRVLGSQSVPVSDFEDYLKKLEENAVLVSQESRRQKIELELTEAVTELGGRIVADDELLEEVVYINEYPTVTAGEFEERFLALPREVLITVMKEHQKYFAVENTDGVLLPCFLAVMNTRSDNKGLIRKGHERVLKARLSDALFFWEVDGKQTLDQRVPGLHSIVFHQELGSYGEKIDQMFPLAETVNGLTDSEVASDVLRQVVRWSKADLTTDLVREFPNLQGIVGGLYARREGAPEEVSEAIYEQYRPASLDDRSPESPAGIVFALTDRFDTLIGCFSVGLIPTGSEDPLGLRRQTQGVIKILLDNELPFSMRALLASDSRMAGDAVRAFWTFYEDRLRYILGRAGFAYDEINAGLATSSDSPTDVRTRVKALHDVRESPDLIAIAGAFKRIKNILKQSDKLGAPAQGEIRGPGMEPAEAALAERVRELEPQVQEWARSGEYRTALEAMASLRSTIDEFFDKILVMHDDAAIRERRLLLLKRLFDTFLQVADISEVVVGN